MTPAFRYRAATAAGELIEGVVQAATPGEAGEALRRQSLVPVSVEADTHGADAGRRWRVRRPEAAAAAVRALALLVGAGVTLERALEFAARHAGHRDVAAALRDVRIAVERGGPLSGALREQPVFGAFAAAVVRAGEESGTLEASLARLAEWLEQAASLRARIRAALLYPALMGIVTSIGVVVLLVVVVPRFVSILGDLGGALPLSTRLLVGASRVVAGGWWLWMPAIVAGVVGARWWLAEPGNRRRWHAARLRLVLAGEIEQAIGTARFARALGVLLESGTPVLSALRIARASVTNDAMAAGLEAAAARVARGERLSESLRGALPPLAVELIAAGEESGTLSEVCRHVAQAHEERAGRELRTLVRLVEPALILVFGGVVGFIALAMLQAVYAVNAGLP